MREGASTRLGDQHKNASARRGGQRGPWHERRRGKNWVQTKEPPLSFNSPILCYELRI